MIRGDVEHGLTYTVRRGDGDTLGENEIQYASEPDAGLHRRRAGAGLAAHRRRVVADLAAGRHPLRRAAVARRRRRRGGARRHRRPGAGQRREPHAPAPGRSADRSTRTRWTARRRGSRRPAGGPGDRGAGRAGALPADLARRTGAGATSHEPPASAPARPRCVRRSRTPRLDLHDRARRRHPAGDGRVCWRWCASAPVHGTDQPPALTSSPTPAWSARPAAPGSPDAGGLDRVAGRPATCRWSRRGSAQSVAVSTGASSPRRQPRARSSYAAPTTWRPGWSGSGPVPRRSARWPARCRSPSSGSPGSGRGPTTTP